MLTPGDELLAVVSARQSLTWRAFSAAFDELHLRALASGIGLEGEAGWIRFRTLRLLSDLAHAEVPPYGEKSAVVVAPTMFSRLPQPGLPRMVLTGSRGLATLEFLKDRCKPFGKDAAPMVISHSACGGYAPTTIAVEATDISLLLKVAEGTGIPLLEIPPAWTLLQTSASIADYEKTLEWTPDPDPSWPRKDFDESTLSFRIAKAPKEYRLSIFTDPVTRRQIHRLWRNGLATKDDWGRDWARWLYLKQQQVNVLLADSDAQTVGVPVTVPLPPLLARALTLFSGAPPTRLARPGDASIDIDLYTCVPEEAVGMLALKLGQSPDQTTRTTG